MSVSNVHNNVDTKWRSQFTTKYHETTEVKQKIRQPVSNLQGKCENTKTHYKFQYCVIIVSSALI